MCTHIRRDLACGHCKFLIHMFCANNRKNGRRCRRFVIHREYWGNTICRECQSQTAPTRYDAAGFKMPYPVKKRPSAAISTVRKGRSVAAATAAAAGPTATTVSKSTSPTPSLVLALAGSSGPPSGSSSEFASNATRPSSGNNPSPDLYDTYDVSGSKTVVKSAGMTMQQPLPQIGV
ncbi:hypothetical protein Cpir12675_005985 [Ceratocystis pirilliformis]|uniref:PHD-type domain-containing protein n=1 Tax=Ceratocystis pirilliformis TaxID=259994 RepID=A0ABR3YM60_9PEZI